MKGRYLLEPQNSETSILEAYILCDVCTIQESGRVCAKLFLGAVDLAALAAEEGAWT